MVINELDRPGSAPDQTRSRLLQRRPGAREASSEPDQLLRKARGVFLLAFLMRAPEAARRLARSARLRGCRRAHPIHPDTLSNAARSSSLRWVMVNNTCWPRSASSQVTSESLPWLSIHANCSSRGGSQRITRPVNPIGMSLYFAGCGFGRNLLVREQQLDLAAGAQLHVARGQPLRALVRFGEEGPDPLDGAGQ